MKGKILCVLVFLGLCWAARNPRDEQFFAFLIATIFFLPVSVAFIFRTKVVIWHLVSAGLLYIAGFVLWHISIAAMRNESIMIYLQDQHSEHEKSLVIFVYSVLVVASIGRIIFLRGHAKKCEVGDAI